MLTELRCTLECRVTSKNDARGTVHSIIDYGPEADLLFVVILDDGATWCVPAKEVRIAPNWTAGRGRKAE